MADNPLDALGNVFDEAVEAAGEVGSELLAGDVEGAVQAAEAGAQETSAAVGEAVTATGGVAAGAAAGAGEEVVAAGAGLVGVGAEVAAAGAGLLGVAAEKIEQVGQSIDIPEVDAGGEIGVEVLGQHVGVGVSAELSDQGLSITTHVQDPLGTRDSSVEVDQGGAEVATHQQGVFGSEDLSVGVDSGGVSVAGQETVAPLGVEIASAEGSFHLGLGGGDEGVEGPSEAVDAGRETGEGVVEGQIGTAANLAAPAGQPLIQTGQYAASAAGSDAAEGEAEIGVTADAGVTEVAVGFEPGVQAGPGSGGAPVGEEPVAVAAETTEPAAVSAEGPGEAVDEVGVSVGVVAEEAVTSVPGAGGEGEAQAVEVETTAPGAVLWEEPGEAVDEVGAPTGVAVAQGTSMPLAAEEVDEVGAPTGVAAAATATTMHLAGGLVEAAGGEEPQAVEVETGEPAAVLWQEPDEAGGSGAEEAAAVTEDAAEDDGGGIGDILKDAAEAVGDFIEDVVDKIKDVFDGDD
ncbi:MAG: hypothetical protein H6Q11_282 [Acidobacteria bacterium]|nr:hypothetical protein [Acidobacteriota bacterium]